VALALLFSCGTGAAQEKKKEWKDRSEYDLYEAVTKTSDPKIWLEHLEKWSKQYPQSDYADVRRKMYLATYRSLSPPRPREAFNTAVAVLGDTPNDLVALSAIVGFVYTLSPPAEPADLETAERAASTILNNLDTIYAKENRPPELNDTEAAKAKPQLKAFAQRTLGWIAWTRKDWPRAEIELMKALVLDPGQAQVSYWLGFAMLSEADIQKQPVALYHFARAASYDGNGSLPPAEREKVRTYLDTVYKKYHGTLEGLSELLAMTRVNAIPVGDVKIKSASEIAKESIAAEQAFIDANPMVGLWRDIRKTLVAPEGETYFEKNMKDAALPGGVNGVAKFKGKIVSMTPMTRPKELVLNIDNHSEGGDVTLKLDTALPGKMEPGSEIEFEGVAKSYTKDPYMVMFDVEKSKIVGWAGKNAPPKRTTGSKKSTTKKS
jgi:hypothetical protein